MTVLGIIGGSGFNQLPDFKISNKIEVQTPYGVPSSAVVSGKFGGIDVLFLARHGESHTIAPHRINYRANMYALKSAGIREVIAFAAVGGISPDTREESIVIPDQIIDYTWGREHTVYDNVDNPESEYNGQLEHVDFTSPYCGGLRSRLLASARRVGVKVIDGGVYAVTQGPRLESAAEIDRLEQDGADIVGMTGMPEAALARELGINYACIALVVNLAAGRGSAEISLALIHRNLEKTSNKALSVVKGLCSLRKPDGA